MAALPLKVPRNQQHSAVCFRLARGRSANAIESEMRPVYGYGCSTKPAIHAWCKKFAYSHKSLLVRDNLVAVFFR